jgi:hypothetical protein
MVLYYVVVNLVYVVFEGGYVVLAMIYVVLEVGYVALTTIYVAVDCFILIYSDIKKEAT